MHLRKSGGNSIGGLTSEESNGLNGCQYLDRVSLKKMPMRKSIRSKPLFWGQNYCKIFHFNSELASQFAAGSSTPKTNNATTGSNNAHIVKRDAKAAPSAAPMRKAVHMPANRAARHQ